MRSRVQFAHVSISLMFFFSFNTKLFNLCLRCNRTVEFLLMKFESTMHLIEDTIQGKWASLVKHSNEQKTPKKTKQCLMEIEAIFCGFCIESFKNRFYNI